MEYLEIMKTIQDRILEFLDDDYNNYYQNADDLATFLISPQAKPDKHDLKSILRLISKITKNHHRCINYYDKIKKLINIYQKEIKQTFSNIDIFNIFKKNKLLILLLIEEEIITINEEILEIMDQNYKKFFYPEIQKIQQNEQESKEIPTDFYLKRRSGENDSYICELIRNDNDIDFISFINKNNISINMEIQDSIFETNSFLLKHKPTLIEYSAFFGSIKIFDYLRMNGANLNQILHLYAIHGNNAEINQILEDSKIERDDSIYDDCFKESVKCHHNEFALYYKNNFNIKIYDNSNYLKNEISFGFRFSNFKYIPNELTEPFCFFYAVDYDYYKLVVFYKDIKELDINSLIIYTKNIL